MNNYSRKERIGWYFYDWANSAFYATVITVFLGPYLSYITKNAADSSGFVHILNIPVYYGSFFPYCVSLSVLLQVIILPIIGSIADYTQSKKLLLGIFAYIGAFATMGLYFLDGSNYLLGGILFIIANLSFGSAVVVYNSFLNDIAPPEKRDSVSSIGWAMGYIGGSILLALNLALYSNAASFRISDDFAIRISLSSAGGWWALFTIITLKYLRQRKEKNILYGKKAKNNLITVSFSQLFNTFIGAKRFPKTLLFLTAYLLYNDGVQTVIVVATQFGSEQMKFDQSFLTMVVLCVNIVAFPGALLFNLIAKWTDNKKAILISLVIWIACVFYTYRFLHNATEFFILAMIIAMVLGVTQALSRSLFSLLIPKGKEAEYFSVYEISERGTSWIGPLIFGLSLQITGSFRIAILSLMIFFIVGFVLLARVNVKKAIEEVKIGN